METQKRNPEDIRNDVIENLAWDNKIDHSNIHVDVVGNIVTLTGTVPSYGDLWDAEHDARVISGVRLVDNRLGVSPGITPALNDDQVQDRVRQVIKWSPAVDASRIDVHVKDRVVTLSGETDTYWQKSKARSLASEVSGVEEVVDRLEVMPRAGITDEEIVEAMDDTINRLNLEIGAVNVTVQGGHVDLTGTVGDYKTYCAVEEVAGCTNGVVEINNELEVE